jgi:SAM-dependent methyltransferase
MKRDIPELLPARSPALNVGAGRQVIPDTATIDYPRWDANAEPYQFLPYLSGTFNTLYAFHFLEHCRNPIPVLLDFQRILRPGGIINIVVPYYNSQMQAHDLDHKSCYTEETWRVLFEQSAGKNYDKNQIAWELKVHACFIMGIVERNIALFTQLIKMPS